MGFLRGFWRTEISAFTGKPVFMDMFWKVDLSSWNRTLSVQLPGSGEACRVADANDSMWRWQVGLELLGWAQYLTFDSHQRPHQDGAQAGKEVRLALGNAPR